MSFEKLFDILKKAQDRYPGFSKRYTEAQALGRWEAAVGPSIAKHSKAIRVQDAVLWVEVDHPIWKSELFYRKRQILEILNGKKKAEAQVQSQAQTQTPAQDPSNEPLLDILFLDHIRSRE